MKPHQTVEETAAGAKEEAPEEDKEGAPEEDTKGDITREMPTMLLKEARPA